MTIRSLFLGLLTALFVVVVQVQTRSSPTPPALQPFGYGSANTLFSGVMFCLFLFALANGLLKRWLPRHALRSGELATIYALSTVAAAIAAYDEVQYLIPMYAYPFRTTQTGTAVAMRPYIPRWQTAQDPKVLERYYMGNGNFWQPEIWGAWLWPVATWTLWILLLGATMWAWNVLLRRRWVEQDRLSFPCVQLPLEMCREEGFGGSVGGKLFWGGFLFAALLESSSFLHARFPDIPGIALGWDATPFLNGLSRPWVALAPMSLNFGAFFLGVCYLIPVDILFSSWFFFLLRRGLEVLGYGLGWRDLGWDAAGFPYVRAQAAGSWAMLFLLLIWAERKHLRATLGAAFALGGRNDNNGDDRHEAAPYRVAGRVLVIGTLLLIVYSIVSGMPPALAIAYNAFFWILNVTMTRVFAQVGPPILEMYYLDPQKTFATLFGTVGQTPASVTQFSLMYWINRDHRGQPMGHQLAAFKVAEEGGAGLRKISAWVVAFFALGGFACLLAHLHFAYHWGEDRFASGGWRESGAPAAIGRVNEWTSIAKGPQWVEVSFMGGAALFTWFLAQMANRFIGSPFHPIGYALAVSYAVEYDWPAFLMVWGAKSLLLRYGGLAMYRRFLPLAFGMTLGGIVTPILWTMTAALLGWNG